MTFWTFGSYLLLPYAIASLLWRGLRYAPYWNRWPERFGFVRRPAAERVIWVHAVSVGEVRSSAALIVALDERYPDHRILVTTMTPTGSEQVKELFGERVSHSYVPFDFPDAVYRFLNRVQPELAVIAETEFWPNIFASLKRRGIPLFLVNVRVSQTALEGYLRVPHTVARMFSMADLLCPQTELDAERLRTLGADPRRIHVTGNLKFDVEVPQSLLQEGAAVRQQWGRDRPVWIAASTHPGEEAQVLDAFKRLREKHPRLLLALVPRHPERFAAVARLCERRRYAISLRSIDFQELGDDVDIVVGDTMGELQKLYAASDVAFVGGSLVPRGGQNILEACAVSVPVIFGPHMFHFEEISALALARGAARQVRDADELAATVSELLSDPERRRSMGEAAHGLMRDNHGALERTLELVDEELGRIGFASRRSAVPSSAIEREAD
ncbi:MAG TPA: lipid IV(A) 3-deoxy-D-manno-octulosonic acid transferase [Gammaproteobacteria bacterium]|nr:lipid IV(A) 3-deoxy-D-manno-octulosonic acid transferase [Gammaproteobacteria bacterium]